MIWIELILYIYLHLLRWIARVYIATMYVYIHIHPSMVGCNRLIAVYMRLPCRIHSFVFESKSLSLSLFLRDNCAKTTTRHSVWHIQQACAMSVLCICVCVCVCVHLSVPQSFNVLNSAISVCRFVWACMCSVSCRAVRTVLKQRFHMWTVGIIR